MILNFSHQKGGTGKSTLAYNLAESYRRRGIKTVLYDLDLQHTCVSLNGLRDKPYDDILTIGREEDLVNVVNAADKDGVIIIDSGGFDSALTRLAIMGADINITPVADRVTELLAVIQKYSTILEEIEENTKDSVVSYILLNKIHPFTERLDHIEEMIDGEPRMKLIKKDEKPLVIRERAVYNKSFIDGRTVFESSELKGSIYAVKEIDDLSFELLKIYKNRGEA